MNIFGEDEVHIYGDDEDENSRKNTILKLSNQKFAVQLIILDSVVKQYVDNIIYRPIYMTLS